VTPLELCEVEAVRSWPGDFLVRTFAAAEPVELLGATSQAHLQDVLTIALAEGITDVLVGRIAAGRTPFPLLVYRPKEGTLMTAPSRRKTTTDGPVLSLETVLRRELESIEAQYSRHLEVAFAASFYGMLAILREYRPKQLPEDLAEIPDERVPHELEETMTRLRKGHEILMADGVRWAELTKRGQKLTAAERDELADLTSPYESVTNPDGSTGIEYSASTAGDTQRLWDDLVLRAYFLSCRLSPTPTAWVEILGPFVTQPEQDALLEVNA
jgi:hypothetical protein